MKYYLINKAEEQCDLLYQLEMQHNLQDPTTIYMELRFSNNFILAEFGIKADYDCKYALQNKFLLQMLNSSLLSSYMAEVLTADWMLSWLHWKHDYT